MSAPRVWYSLAWGHPDPIYTHAGPKIESENTAHLLRAQRQAEELPPEEGGATWYVLRIEVVA